MDALPTLLLLPGLACDEALFRHQLPALRERGLAVRVADVHARHDTLPAMADALLAEHEGELLLAGCSMGGMVAQLAALRGGERVRGLMLLGSSARADTPELKQLRREACEMFAAGQMDDVLQANVAFAFHPSHGRDPLLVSDYLAMIRRAGPWQLVRQNRALIAREDLRPLLPALRGPLWLACGEDDLLTPPEQSREIAAAVPGARLDLLPRCGHMLTWEQPASVLRLMLGWLDQALHRA